MSLHSVRKKTPSVSKWNRWVCCPCGLWASDKPACRMTRRLFQAGHQFPPQPSTPGPHWAVHLSLLRSHTPAVLLICLTARVQLLLSVLQLWTNDRTWSGDQQLDASTTILNRMTSRSITSSPHVGHPTGRHISRLSWRADLSLNPDLKPPYTSNESTPEPEVLLWCRRR